MVSNKMSKVSIRENLRFVGRYILPPSLVVIAVFLVIVWVFPTSSLSIEVFTIIYWVFSTVPFLLNYQTKRWTDYVVNHYGLHREKNPTMRRMYATKNFREQKVGLIGMFVALLVFYIVGVNAQTVLPFLILPSWFLAVILYDFLNDFYWIRRLKKQEN
jgi:hypothetical protein